MVSYFEEVFFSEVGAVSLTHQSRQLSVPPLIHLEGQGCGSFGGGGVAEPIFNLFHITSIPLLVSNSLRQLLPLFHQRDSSAGGNLGFDQERSSKARSCLSWVLQLHFCGDEAFELVEAHYRPLIPGQVRSSLPVQEGNLSVRSWCHSERRLDVLHQLEGCLPSGSCPSGEQEIPLLCSVQQGFSVHGPMIWPLHGPSGLYQGHGSCFDHSAHVSG